MRGKIPVFLDFFHLRCYYVSDLKFISLSGFARRICLPQMRYFFIKFSIRSTVIASKSAAAASNMLMMSWDPALARDSPATSVLSTIPAVQNAANRNAPAEITLIFRSRLLVLMQ